MQNLTDTNAQKLARLLFSIEEGKRLKIISCLDTDFQLRVMGHLAVLKSDMPYSTPHNTPPGKVPNCS